MLEVEICRLAEAILLLFGRLDTRLDTRLLVECVCEAFLSSADQ